MFVKNILKIILQTKNMLPKYLVTLIQTWLVCVRGLKKTVGLIIDILLIFLVA